MNRFIIDGFNLAYRAFYAFPQLTTSAGVPSGCVYGFLSTLRSLKSKRLDCQFCIAWDHDARRKKEAFSAYKANRPTFSLSDSISDLKTLIKSLNILQAEAIGEEADDVIASLVSKKTGTGIDYIYSADKDLLQLVLDGKAIVIRPGKGSKEERAYDEEAVKTEFGVYPKDFPCLLALRGDTIDNIPGVARVPTSLLSELSNRYHCPEHVYENISLEKLTDFQRKGIEASKNQVFLNFGLVKLREDIEFDQVQGESSILGVQAILDKYEIKAISAENYVNLFQRQTYFLARTAPSLKNVSLFDEGAE